MLLADLQAIAAKASVVVEPGNPPDVILRRAEADACGLIVTGVARDEPFGRLSLGKTVDRLLRRSRAPL